MASGQSAAAFVEGETAPKTYTLYSGTTAQSLTGMTVTAVVRRRDQTYVSDTGTVTPDADQSTYPGRLTWTPAAGTLRAQNSPYYIRFRAVAGSGAIAYYPSSGDGLETPVVLP